MSSRNGRWQFDARESQIGFGRELTDPHQSHVVTGFTFETVLREDDINDVEYFLDDLHGRAYPFWLPGPTWAFEITSGISTSSFKIRGQGASATWSARPGQYLHFSKSGADSQTGKVQSVTRNSDGNETVALSSALPVAVDETWAVVPLYLVRLAGDDEEIEVLAERCQRRKFVVVELPHDYARIGGDGITLPNEPVFLYRWTLSLPDGDITWRHTSHPTDVTVSAALWSAVAIDHSGLSRSAKNGGTVTISGDYDAVEPLKLSVPIRYVGQLKLEILETTTALGTPTSRFYGIVTRPDLAGRRVTAQCIEWGDVMSVRVPAMHIDRECNYDVFDATTCKALEASFTYSVTITAVSGTTVTITGAGLASLAANWFARGKLKIGSGLTQELVAILASTAASGTTVTLTVNRSPAVEVPVSASAIAGCDGLRATCISKFNNLVNFGGHAPPRTNLTLTAIEHEQAGGKK
jgi:hypothetical protein